eukprot:767475-Hanusia_phi.AAC.4
MGVTAGQLCFKPAAVVCPDRCWRMGRRSEGRPQHKEEDQQAVGREACSTVEMAEVGRCS